MTKEKRIIFLKGIFVVLVLFIIFSIISFLIGKYTIKYEKPSNDDIEIKFFSDNIITLNNILPLSDKLALSTSSEDVEKGIVSSKDFSVLNTTDKTVYYQIYIKCNFKENNIKPSFIKVFLSDKNNKPYSKFNSNSVPQISDLYVLNDMPDSLLLYSDYISGLQKKNYVVKSWISDVYSSLDKNDQFSYSLFIRVV